MTEYLDLVARLDTSDAQSDLQQLANSTGFDELEKTVGRLCDQMEGFSDTLKDLSQDVENAAESINKAAENMSKGGSQLNDVIARVSVAALGSMAKSAANTMAKVDPENKTAWKAVGNVASAGLKGAAIGASIGSIIPGVGTLVGAGVGTLVGGGMAAIGAWKDAKKEAQAITDKQEEADAKAKQASDKRAQKQAAELEKQQTKADQASFARGLEGLNLNQLTAKSSEIDEQIREQEEKRAAAIEQAQKFNPGSHDYAKNLRAAQDATEQIQQLNAQKSAVTAAQRPLEREQRQQDREAKQAAREQERAEKLAAREQERAEKEAARQKEKEERDAAKAALALQRENEKKEQERARQLDASADVLGKSLVGGQDFGLSQLESMGAMIGGGGRQENVQNYLQRQIDYLRDIAGNTRGINTSTNDNYYG